MRTGTQTTRSSRTPDSHLGNHIAEHIGVSHPTAEMSDRGQNDPSVWAGGRISPNR